MWAQDWNNLKGLLTPYPDKPSLDVTDKMKSLGWTAKKMFQITDKFFQSMGMPPMPEAFWEHSVLERPDDGRELNCHASAWDFYNNKDYRIKQCASVTHNDFLTVNHEMGHIQYDLAYQNLSYLYKGGANPGFHEGVADITAIGAG